MNIKFRGKHLSITSFEWLDIPTFAIITGKNGCGKTQLLALIENKILQDSLDPKPDYAKQLIIEGENFQADEVSFQTGEWELLNTESIDLSLLLTNIRNVFSEFQGYNPRSYNRHKTRLHETFKKIAQKAGVGNRKVTFEQFQNLLPEIIIENETQLGQKIAEIFYNYRLREIELLADGNSKESIIKLIGAQPWTVLNEIIKEAKLLFEFSDPSTIRVRDSYKFQLFKLPDKEEVLLSNLSSGEKVLFSLIFLLFNSQEKKVFPKFMLLDEPDAHLHPSMSKQLLNVLKNVLVDKYGVRIIMTTHSPSTVILASEESLFEMTTSEPRIRKVVSKNSVVSMLTDGLVFVGEGTKYFIVEDTDDVAFYNHVYGSCVSNGAISGDIPMVFIPASTTTKSGGKTVVQDWVTKLQGSGILNLIHGLIDEDDGNVVQPGIYKIKRYSIENYLIDPIITYAALMDKNLQNSVLDKGLRLGDEYKLKILDNASLQEIADAVIAKVSPLVQRIFSDFNIAEDSKLVEVEFILGHRLKYPQWLFKRKGKKILNGAYISAFSSSVMNHDALFKALQKINFIPSELSSHLDGIRRV